MSSSEQAPDRETGSDMQTDLVGSGGAVCRGEGVGDALHGNPSQKGPTLIKEISSQEGRSEGDY